MFVLSKLAWLLVSPDAVLLILVAVATALLWTRRWRTGRAILLGAVAASLAIATLPIGPWLMRPLENRFPTVRSLPEKVDGIVVLGGAVSPRLTIARGQPALNAAAERMTEFVALARRHPEAKLVYTGGSGSVVYPELKEVPVARQLFASLGVDVGHMVFEDQSRNTYENALFTRNLVKPQPGETWIVVTSAFHMPRAYGCFSRVGWRVVPYPVDYMTRPGYELTLDFDFLGGLNMLALALHEWVGLIAYRVLDHTDALFPSPP
jgi:uncharacterized SAM-binding protein YcdF (DUF218 family)